MPDKMIEVIRKVTGAGGPPSGPAGGELAGTYPNPTVATIHSGTAHGTLGAPTVRTIAAGVIDVTGLHYVIVNGEGGVDDVLVNMTGGVDGQIVFLEQGIGTIEFGRGSGMIYANQERTDDFFLGNFTGLVTALYSATASAWWIEADYVSPSIMSSGGSNEIIVSDADGLNFFVTGGKAMQIIGGAASKFGVFSRADSALAAAQQTASTLAALWTALKAYGWLDSGSTAPAGGATGPSGPPGMDGLDGEEGPSGIPGPAGTAGAAGSTGAQGPVGPAVFLVGEDGEEGPVGPMGLAGAAGAAGSTGAQGPVGPAVFLEAPEGEEGIPGMQGLQGFTGAQGPVGPAVFLAGEDGADGEVGAPGTGFASPNDTGPLFGLYAPGGFNVMAGRYAVMANHLILSSTQRAVLQGTARLSIYT